MSHNSKAAPVVSAAAYAVPATEDDERWHEEEEALGLKPYTLRDRNTVHPAFRHIPEAKDLTWEDDFFEDDEDVIAVFDFDYDQMESFYTSVGWVSFGLTLIYPPIFFIGLLALTPCFLRPNVEWSVRAQHVAITPDGIRYVENRRKNCWGLACFDKGKNSKTVPYDKITDCDIVEPAGNQCICCVPRVLHLVNIDTASSNQMQHELQLAGLKNPHRFKKLVWAMKRSYARTHSGGNASHDASGKLTANNGMGGADQTLNREMLSMLREIRDELRQNNETLNLMRENNQVVPATAVPSVAASAPFQEPPSLL